MKPREERIEHIRKVHKVAFDDPSLTNYYTISNWRGKALYRKIIQIDSEYLMFRIENSRTEIQQLAFLRKHALSIDFFGDPESLQAQQAQEDILIEMIREKGKDLLDDLRDRQQNESCIITYDGYIVNGNRRTAALKMLGERYIDCVVLPEDASPKDIYFLEQQLQISQTFREDYHWINELKNIRKGIQDARLGLTEKEVALNLHMDVRDLRVKIRTLDLIDAFLFWKEIPGQYDYPKLDDTQEIFQQLEKALKKYSKEPLKQESLQNAVFNLIEVRPGPGRLYNHVMVLFRSFDQVVSRMTSDIDAEPPKGNSYEVPDKEPDILDEILEAEKSNQPDLFDNHQDAQDTASKLMEVIADVEAENKEKRNSEAVYEAVSSALRDLQGLVIDEDTSKISTIRRKLEQILSVSERLLKRVESFEQENR